MEEILAFIESYGSYILTGLCLVLQVVYFFVKKRPQTIDDFFACVEKAFDNVPVWCSLVEVPGKGLEKKESVINLALNFMKRYLHRTLSDSEVKYVSKYVSDYIELVLSAPKKGDNNESR